MRHTFLFLILFVAFSLSSGATSLMKEDYPILPESLERMAGEAIWYYAWPHGLLPLEPNEFELVTGPFDLTGVTHGKKMNNWGMKTTYRSNKDDVQLSAWVLEDKRLEDRTMFAVGPIMAIKDQGTSRTCEFHKLKAGIGVWDIRNAPSEEIDRFGRVQGSRCVSMAFRLEDKLFLLSSRDRKPVKMVEKSLLRFAEQVYRRNMRNINKESTRTNQSTGR